MENYRTVNLEDNNIKTIVKEDPEKSKYFWNDFYSLSFQENERNFFIESPIDLMGNIIEGRKHEFIKG